MNQAESAGVGGKGWWIESGRGGVRVIPLLPHSRG